MAGALTYKTEAAAGYDRAFGHVTSHFAPFLLQAGGIASGMNVLDIAAGTGLVSEQILTIVGSSGHVTAADLSPAMAGRARERFAGLENVVVAVEDGQALSFADQHFDAVICSLGLMFFPDPLQGLKEFHRVLRPGGRVAVSVNTVPERSYNNFVNLAIAKHRPAMAVSAAQLFTIGSETRLRSLFEAANFKDTEIKAESHRFVLPSFRDYFEPIERGAGSPGQAFITLSTEEQAAVREDVRHSLNDSGGPIDVEVEFRFAAGQHG